MTRNYGRAPGGQRMAEGTPQSHWHTVTMLAALTIQGLQAPMTIESPTDGDVFLAYLEQVLCPQLRAGQMVIMDDLSAYKVAGVQQLIATTGARLMYLPPYSPGFNPIEQAWSKIKQLLRSAKARSVEPLQGTIAEALRAITADKASAWFSPCGYGLNNVENALACTRSAKVRKRSHTLHDSLRCRRHRAMQGRNPATQAVIETLIREEPSRSRQSHDT